MERKLVSVQTIAKLEPISGADFIEKATVMGWSLVVKKGEFEVGDRCAFFEIDSVLPEKDWSEFMRPSKFRVKTKKMKGVLSQGLALPLSSCLPAQSSFDYQVGDDMTQLCEVIKFEPVIPEDSKDQAAGFPSFVPKTDEIRVQSAIAVLDELRGKTVYFSLKCDGTSATYAKLDDKLYVCSRNYELKPGQNAYWQMVDQYNLTQLPDGFAVQGEICGPGIQKNRLGLKGLDLFVFSVFDIQAGRFLDFDSLCKFCTKWGLQTVPILSVGQPFNYSLEDLLTLAEGYYEDTKNHREGIVVRPIVETHSQVLQGQLSIKVINNQYLLKGGED
ncbi:RNA ligase (ATP) [Phormidesmis sp. 146-35]